MGKSSANNLIFVQGIWNGINLINADFYINPNWFLLKVAKIYSGYWLELKTKSISSGESHGKSSYFFLLVCTPQLIGISGICTGDTIRDVSKISKFSEMCYKHNSSAKGRKLSGKL